MIKRLKFLSLIVAILMIATTGFAFNQSEKGLINIDACYVTDIKSLVSGDVVVLQTSSPTYWGREVTGSTTADQMIHGVVVNISPTSFLNGGWVNVQTYGYCPIVNITSDVAMVALKTKLSTSGTAFRAKGTGVSGNTVTLETVASPAATTTIKAYLGH